MERDSLSFSERYGTWAIVAGASDGVGAAYARAIGERGLNVVLIARRHSLLDELASEIRARSHVEVLPIAIDLATPDAASRVIETAGALEVGMVMYNAGQRPDQSTVPVLRRRAPARSHPAQLRRPDGAVPPLRRSDEVARTRRHRARHVFRWNNRDAADGRLRRNEGV